MEQELAITREQLEVSTTTNGYASDKRVKELEEQVETLRAAGKTLADRYKLGEMVRSRFRPQIRLR
jgi:hypothetical protein